MATVKLSGRQRKALQRFSHVCRKVGYLVPDAVRDVLDNPLGGRDDLTEEDKQDATARVKRHGCYTQWARNLRVRSIENSEVKCATFVKSFQSLSQIIGVGKTKRRPLPKYSFPEEVLTLVRTFYPGQNADHSPPPGVS